jgi:WD40 repeat protein
LIRNGARAAALFAALILPAKAPAQGTAAPAVPPVATGGADQTIRSFDAMGKPVLNFLAHEGRVNALIIYPDGKRLISAGDKTIKFWNADDGSLDNSLDAHEKEVLCLSLSPDGHILASGGADAMVKLWNPLTGKLLKSIPAHTMAVRALAWSPDNRFLASAGSDRLIQLWRADGSLAGTIIAHDEPVITLAWSRDGRAILGGTADGYLKAWNVDGLGLIGSKHAHDKSVFGVATQKSGDLIATCGSDGRIKVWTYGQRNFTQLGEAGGDKPMYCVSFAGGGKFVLTGGAEKLLHYWSSPDLKEILKVPAHDSAITTIAVPPG